MDTIANYDISNLLEVCSTLQDEIKIHKLLLEDAVSKNLPYEPLAVFYSDPQTRILSCSTPPLENYEDFIVRTSEILHLYPTLNSHSVCFSFTQSFSDTHYFYFYLISDTHAWRMTYSFDVSQASVAWNDEDNSLVAVSDIDLDSDFISEFVNVLFMHSHALSSPFTSSEVLSYLSTLKCTIKILNSKPISYYDFSDNNFI